MVVVTHFCVMLLVAGIWSWCSQRGTLAPFHKLDLAYIVICNANLLVIAPMKLVCIYAEAHGKGIVICFVMPRQWMAVQLSTHYLLVCSHDELLAMASHFSLD
ncbi:hypothetical protein Scep_011344 [Stephania cephalantha]|uniref:Uncharacterized protein n=1 Tax=Stephania cephalantha TaxID=152367 RepID=A0AAP0P8T6_9MAGN